MQLCTRRPLQDMWQEVRLLEWLDGGLESAEGWGFFFFFNMLWFSMILFALLQTSWLTVIEQMLEYPCCFSTLFVHLGLWWLLEGLLVKIMTGLSGEESITQQLFIFPGTGLGWDSLSLFLWFLMSQPHFMSTVSWGDSSNPPGHVQALSSHESLVFPRLIKLDHCLERGLRLTGYFTGFPENVLWVMLGKQVTGSRRGNDLTHNLFSNTFPAWMVLWTP